MLKKIDCVLIKVTDLEAAAKFYAETFGLLPQWSDETSYGLRFSDSDAEIVLHTNASIPVDVDVNYLVEHVPTAFRRFLEQGCASVIEPFEIAVGRCAVVKDPFGIVHSFLDLSNGLRINNRVTE